VDNLSTGRLENLSAALDRVVFIRGDVAEVDLPQFDVAFHGAALPAPDYYVQRPVETWYNSVSRAHLPRSVGEGVCCCFARTDTGLESKGPRPFKRRRYRRLDGLNDQRRATVWTSREEGAVFL